MNEERYTVTVTLDEELHGRLVRVLGKCPGANLASLSRVLVQDALARFEESLKLPMFKMERKGGGRKSSPR